MSSVDCKHFSFTWKSVGKNAMKKQKQVWLRVWHAQLHISPSRTHDLPLTSHHSQVLRSSLRSSPRIFKQKRDCLQSMSSSKKFARNVREQLFLYWRNCDELLQPLPSRSKKLWNNFSFSWKNSMRYISMTVMSCFEVNPAWIQNVNKRTSLNFGL